MTAIVIVDACMAVRNARQSTVSYTSSAPRAECQVSVRVSAGFRIL